MLKYFIFILTLWTPLTQAMNTISPKIDEAWDHCMQNHGHMYENMKCAKVIISLSFSEKASEADESDSACVKTCKKDLAAVIARERNSKPEEETLFPLARLLLAEKRAKLLKEQFLQCMKTCKP